MSNEHIVIIGGGLAGLSAGCYARASGFRTTILEHNLALGGVCTSWKRGRYVVDGCIHWLTGGPFIRVYEELGILPRVHLRALKTFSVVRDARDRTEIEITADLEALGRALGEIAPEDRDEIDRFIAGAHQIAEMKPPFDKPRDLYGLRDAVSMMWSLRGQLPTMVHFRGTMAEYATERLKNERLRRVLAGIVPAEAPVLFLLMVLGYLSRGWLSRPVGGTEAFRDALIESYASLGGVWHAHTTVDEVLVKNGAARGVRLADGTMIEADAVISTSSIPETIFRLLGGRFDRVANERRMQEWKMFTPIVLASYGVEMSLAHLPGMVIVQGIDPFDVGGRINDSLYLRVCNDDPSFAPEGHAVVQAMLQTDYTWWAERGADYNAAKEELGERVLAVLDRHIPGVRAARRMTDLATPLTYWNMARSWRGAYEGWMPRSESMFSGLGHRLEELDDLYLAGQWVEPGGGVPTACSSGRQAVQLLCEERKVPFRVPNAPS